MRTDILICSTEFGNEWMLFSGRGASLIDALTLPVVNTAGSIYLNHNGLHYEPVLGLGKSDYYRRSYTISVYICHNKFSPPFHCQRVYKFWSQIQLYLAPEFLYSHTQPDFAEPNPNLIRTRLLYSPHYLQFQHFYHFYDLFYIVCHICLCFVAV